MENVGSHLYDELDHMFKVQGLSHSAELLRIGCMTNLCNRSNGVNSGSPLGKLCNASMVIRSILPWTHFLVRDYAIIEAAFKCYTMPHNMNHNYDKGFHTLYSSEILNSSTRVLHIRPETLPE